MASGPSAAPAGSPPAAEATSLFVELGEGRWVATQHTAGPWDRAAQHGGAASALLARAVERTAPRPEMMVARFTSELLGPVPVGELGLRSRVTRPGRSVEQVEAVLAAGGRDVARATAWRVLRAAGADVPPRHPQPPPLPAGPTPGEVGPPQRGFVGAIEWRATDRGRMTQLGPAAVWMRLRRPLVDGEETSPLQRVMALADNGNGISSETESRTTYFINPELTVHLHREPVGEWICIDATTTISPGGAGLATSVLSDVDGPVGVGAQALLVGPRG